MPFTIKTPIDKAALSVACDNAGMSDGAKQAFMGYFASVCKEYTSIVDAPQPKLQPQTVTAATDNATAATGVTL